MKIWSILRTEDDNGTVHYDVVVETDRGGKFNTRFRDMNVPPTIGHVEARWLNKNQKWVMHYRARRGCCKVNVNKGPKLVDALSRGLISLFGAERYEAIRDDVAAQRDPEIEVPDSISEEWSIEQDLRICGTVPKPRREWI